MLCLAAIGLSFAPRPDDSLSKMQIAALRLPVSIFVVYVEAEIFRFVIDKLYKKSVTLAKAFAAIVAGPAVLALVWMVGYGALLFLADSKIGSIVGVLVLIVFGVIFFAAGLFGGALTIARIVDLAIWKATVVAVTSALIGFSCMQAFAIVASRI